MFSLQTFGPNSCLAISRTSSTGTLKKPACTLHLSNPIPGFSHFTQSKLRSTHISPLHLFRVYQFCQRWNALIPICCELLMLLFQTTSFILCQIIHTNIVIYLSIAKIIKIKKNSIYFPWQVFRTPFSASQTIFQNNTCFSWCTAIWMAGLFSTSFSYDSNVWIQFLINHDLSW
jgi:hypothetical protein